MPRIATRHAHRLAYRRRLSLGVRMLGCLTLLAGAMVLAAALAEVVKGGLPRPVSIMVALGAVLFVGGAILFCGEHGKLFDAESRTLCCWWGVILPLRRTWYDLQTYQAIGVQACTEEGLGLWRVVLWNVHGERLELFKMKEAEVAQLAARQVAAFLSLSIAPPPFSGAATAAADLVPSAGPDHSAPPAAAIKAGGRWTHSERFGLAVRGLGVVLLTFGVFLLSGFVIAGNAENHRWPQALAVATPLWLLGLWCLLGSRRVVVDVAEQIVSIHSAWPLPPAAYDLASFYAVVIAPASEAPQAEPSAHWIGLIGPEQVRLDLVHAMRRDEAHAIASQLAATARLPVIDASQLAASPPAANIVP